MSKTEVQAIVRHKFPHLNEQEEKILQEFCQAVEYRLNQVREPFNESQCLKSWQSYRDERISVYNAIAATAAKR